MVICIWLPHRTDSRFCSFCIFIFILVPFSTIRRRIFPSPFFLSVFFPPLSLLFVFFLSIPSPNRCHRGFILFATFDFFFSFFLLAAIVSSRSDRSSAFTARDRIDRVDRFGTKRWFARFQIKSLFLKRRSITLCISLRIVQRIENF